MSSLFEPLAQMVTPELVATLAKKLDVEQQQAQDGLGTARALLTTGMANQTTSLEGAHTLREIITKADPNLLAQMQSYADKFVPGSGRVLVDQLLGEHSLVLQRSVSRAVGTDITPLLELAAPLMVGLVANRMQKDGLNMDDIARALKSDADALLANGGTGAVLQQAYADADTVQGKLAQYTADERRKLTRAPIAAGALVMAADLSNKGGLKKETEALRATLLEQTETLPVTSLVANLYGDDGLSEAEIAEIKTSLQSMGVGEVHDAFVSLCAEANQLAARVGTEDGTTYRDTLMLVAQNVAEAVKEGGFMGMGGERVSEAEQQALDELATALGIEPTS